MCPSKNGQLRATIVCLQAQRVLLVARAASRWALPGGTIKAGEAPFDAAHRELWEETGLVGLNLTYAMHFGGLSKLYHVFIGELGADLKPQASNEVARCKLFRHDTIAELRAFLRRKSSNWPIAASGPHRQDSSRNSRARRYTAACKHFECRSTRNEANMISAYTYCGYTIDVRCEHKVDGSHGDAIACETPPGFVAIVQVRAARARSFFLAPIRLADEQGKPFIDRLDALRAGRSAGEIIVDDLLVDTCSDGSGVQR